jgi:hypothetical protein
MDDAGTEVLSRWRRATADRARGATTRTSGGTMKIKSKVRAGGVGVQHNATKSGLKIKSKVRAGGLSAQHNATRL